MGTLGALAGGVTGCARDCGEWSEPEVVGLDVAADLHAVAVDPSWNGEGAPPFHAVGADGLIVAAGDTTRSDRPVEVDLRAVAHVGDVVIAVGDAGTVVRGPGDGSGAWELVDVGVTQDLHAVVPLGRVSLALGDDVVLVHDLDADTWTAAQRPPAGWGSLRAGFRDPHDGTYWVVGLAGAAWSTSDPLGSWQRADLETDADLMATAGDQLVFGGDGVILGRRGGVWRALDSDASVDFVDAADTDVLLTADGRLLGLRSLADGGLQRSASLEPGMTAVAVGPAGESPEDDRTAIVVGTGGRAVRLEHSACEVSL